ncbi:uncharacterized protein SPPG_04972 [Spizellomyces punctatus DAOM BR117]|uniref:Uncharacterized protein n=1 Tax=Spizellomyces punctatus (strain DAOM BR117) TaxID=645134 RepID=A0A0L0HF89_SPIPD|nr:uncharacterized protein SPPG_04972 [Spizellomyces punctatus DAOM BR117]KNC99584.1 hypothetical protein SPPG_04972 [Spizellomyces punctatus DAOM BR117]|eukprot:XP_016607624.1 hypothetical protein SPPG_04972 [Spizellomyces punctatus DAOM BR117]
MERRQSPNSTTTRLAGSPTVSSRVRSLSAATQNTQNVTALSTTASALLAPSGIPTVSRNTSFSTASFLSLATTSINRSSRITSTSFPSIPFPTLITTQPSATIKVLPPATSPTLTPILSIPKPSAVPSESAAADRNGAVVGHTVVLIISAAAAAVVFLTVLGCLCFSCFVTYRRKRRSKKLQAQFVSVDLGSGVEWDKAQTVGSVFLNGRDSNRAIETVMDDDAESRYDSQKEAQKESAVTYGSPEAATEPSPQSVQPAEQPMPSEERSHSVQISPNQTAPSDTPQSARRPARHSYTEKWVHHTTPDPPEVSVHNAPRTSIRSDSSDETLILNPEDGTAVDEESVENAADSQGKQAAVTSSQPPEHQKVPTAVEVGKGAHGTSHTADEPESTAPSLLRPDLCRHASIFSELAPSLLAGSSTLTRSDTIRRPRIASTTSATQTSPNVRTVHRTNVPRMSGIGPPPAAVQTDRSSPHSRYTHTSMQYYPHNYRPQSGVSEASSVGRVVGMYSSQAPEVDAVNERPALFYAIYTHTPDLKDEIEVGGGDGMLVEQVFRDGK